MQQSTLVITVDSRQAEKNIKQLDRELIALTAQGEKTSSGIGNAFSKLTTYAAGFLTVATAISKVDMFTNLQNRLKLVTNSQQDLNTAMADTFRIAQESRQAWDSVVQVYQRFGDNAKNLNISMQQTAQLTDTVSKAVAISGASAASAEAALTQFGQALASNVLRGEELNSVLEQTPGLAKAIAQGMGITVGELRSVAAEGKITGEVLVAALTKAKASVDELFSRTDMTIAQSITVLSNEVTKFVGEAGRGSGAADALAGSIKLLAENISLIADVALAAGIGYITKAIIAKTVAVEADIAASIASRNAAIAVAQAELAEATAATNAAKAHLANTQATNAEAQAKYGATAAATRYTVAQAAVTAATNAQTAAQTRLTAATAIFGRVATGALALVGGPIGVLAIAVTGAVFAFNKMSQANEEANKKLLEMSKYAQMTAQELDKLEGTQKRAAKDDLQKSFEEKNKRLKELSYQFNATIIDMQNYAKGNAEVAKISNDVRLGIITQSEAIKRLNKLDLFTANQIQSAEDANQKYREQLKAVVADEKALGVFKVTVKLAGNEAENAAYKIDTNTSAAKDNKDAIEKATKAQQEYAKSLSDRTFYAGFKTRLIERYGFSKEEAEELAKAQEAAGGRGKKISAESAKAALAAVEAEKKLGDTIKAKENAIKDGAKVEKDAAKQREKYAKDAIKFSEEQAEVMYRYGSDETKRSVDLQKEIANLEKYGLTQYVAIAKTRYEEEKKLSKMNFEYDLVEFRLSEEKKIRYRANIREQEIIADTRLTKEQTEQKLASLKIETAQQLYDARLAQKQRIFNAEEFQYSEMERIKKRYELEREEIGKTHDVVERNALLQANIAKQRIEEFETLAKYAEVIQSTRQSAADELFQKKSPDQYAKFQLQNQYGEASGQLQGAHNNQVAGINLIEDEQTRNAQLLEVHEQYLQAKQALDEQYAEKEIELQRSQTENRLSQTAALVSQTSAYWGSMTQVVKEQMGEQSETYKVMYSAQKLFAIGSATINALQAYNQILASPWYLDVISKTTAANIVLGMGMANVGMIAGQALKGFATGGHITGKGTGTSDSIPILASNGEFMMRTSSVNKIGLDNLDYMNKTGLLPKSQANNTTVNVEVINQASGTKVETQQIDENRVRIIVRDEVNRFVPNQIADSNSKISKSMQRHTTARRERM